MRKLSYILMLFIAISNLSFGQTKTGTLKVFSEIEGISVYLDDSKVESYSEIKDIPIGTHYLKALKDGENVFGELVTINGGMTTTVLIKNTGQVQQKLLGSKTQEIQEYNSSKIEILTTSRSVTTTTGSNTLFPGYYGYYGYSNSVSSTQNIADFKIVQGGIKAISDASLANLAGNQEILNQFARDNLRSKRNSSVGAPLLLVGAIGTLVVLGDLMVDKPFLHKTPEHPDWEVYAGAGFVFTGVLGSVMLGKSNKLYPNHYYNIDEAARDAREYNTKLKQKLGLPENYDVK